MRICHDSNDTLLSRCGVAHFENTRAKGYIYFIPKSWITLLNRINVTISNISVNWFNEDMPRFQWRLALPMWSCPLREHSCQMLHIPTHANIFVQNFWINTLSKRRHHYINIYIYIVSVASGVNYFRRLVTFHFFLNNVCGKIIYHINVFIILKKCTTNKW